MKPEFRWASYDPHTRTWTKDSLSENFHSWEIHF